MWSRKWCCWRLKSAGKLCHVNGQVACNIVKDSSTSNCRFESLVTLLSEPVILQWWLLFFCCFHRHCCCCQCPCPQQERHHHCHCHYPAYLYVTQVSYFLLCSTRTNKRPEIHTVLYNTRQKMHPQNTGKASYRNYHLWEISLGSEIMC